MFGMNRQIGIRPIIDGRRAERANLEDKIMQMALSAKALIEGNVRYPDCTPLVCVISHTTISGSA